MCECKAVGCSDDQINPVFTEFSIQAANSFEMFGCVSELSSNIYSNAFSFTTTQNSHMQSNKVDAVYGRHYRRIFWYVANKKRFEALLLQFSPFYFKTPSFFTVYS